MDHMAYMIYILSDMSDLQISSIQITSECHPWIVYMHHIFHPWIFLRSQPTWIHSMDMVRVDLWISYLDITSEIIHGDHPLISSWEIISGYYLWISSMNVIHGYLWISSLHTIHGYHHHQHTFKSPYENYQHHTIIITPSSYHHHNTITIVTSSSYYHHHGNSIIIIIPSAFHHQISIMPPSSFHPYKSISISSSRH